MTTTAITPTTTPGAWLRQMYREIERDPRLASEESRRGYRHDLGKFEKWREGRPMTKLLVEEYASDLRHGNPDKDITPKSPNTINRSLAAVRWWARKLADLSFEDRSIDRAKRDEVAVQAARIASVKDVTGSRAPKGRHIAPGELAALMQACAADPKPSGTRDAAIIAVAWATGARRSELAELSRSSFVATGDDEGDLRIHGKGDKVRTVYVYNGAAAALLDWLAIRGDDDGPLFYAINRGGHVQIGHGVSDEALAQMLAKRVEQARLSDKLTWHDFRRSFAGNLLDNGADLVTVQKLMGHSSPTTTSNYDRRGEEVKRRAVHSLHVPYRKRAK